MTRSRRFPHRLQSVPEARRFARDVLDGQAPELLEAVALMVSELATNSIKHAASDFELTIDASKRRLRIAVSDSGPGVPELRDPGPQTISGRGLPIVKALSDSWGVTRRADGKDVWFVLSLQ